jgi:hypothetical protein
MHLPRFRAAGTAGSFDAVNSYVFRERRQTPHLPEWTALSGAVYAHEVRIATFNFEKLVESGTSRLRNVFRRQGNASTLWLGAVGTLTARRIVCADIQQPFQDFEDDFRIADDSSFD